MSRKSKARYKLQRKEQRHIERRVAERQKDIIRDKREELAIKAMQRRRRDLQFDRTDQQEKTRPVTIKEIIECPQFAMGVNDKRAGRPFRAEYEKWKTNDQWSYERGRLWATLVPANTRVFSNKEVSEKAIRLFLRYTHYIL